ncbi:hypothetical protein Vretimale_1870, partial [Volvox reticuliferus]
MRMAQAGPQRTAQLLLLLPLLLLPLAVSACAQTGNAREAFSRRSRALLQCAAWSSDVADAIAQKACGRANGDCPRPMLGSQVEEPSPPPPPPPQCYKATKDKCVNDA